jgi:hypothetical protein
MDVADLSPWHGHGHVLTIEILIDSHRSFLWKCLSIWKKVRNFAADY